MTINLVESPSNASQAELVTVPRILAFEMQIGGHHPSYIRNIARLWTKQQLPATIEFLVTPPFIHDHKEVVEEVSRLSPNQIRIGSISDQEYRRIESAGFRREFEGWKTFCQHARQRHADHGVLMYSDHFQLPMLFGQASPCPMTCVYFRPTFHYSQWPEHKMDFKQRVAALRKKLILQQFLKIKQLHYLFCLDEFVPSYIEQNFRTKVKPLIFPDSFVRLETSISRVRQLRHELGIEPGRKVLLLLGILDYRKGPVELLDATLSLPKESQRELCLLLIGKISPEIEQDVFERIKKLRAISAVQVIFNNEYVQDTFVQHYYELADVALTTYQQHKGMSSALMRAALAEVPVLSSSYGLMGELVRRHQMGITTDTGNPEAFTTGLKNAIEGEAAKAFNLDKSLAFANQHNPEAFGKALKDWVNRIATAVR